MLLTLSLCPGQERPQWHKRSSHCNRPGIAGHIALSLCGELLRSDQVMLQFFATAGGDEALHGSIAACLGQWAQHCSREEAAALLQQGPLAAHQSPDWTERLGQALTMAAVAQHAASRSACLQMPAAISTYMRCPLPCFPQHSLLVLRRTLL